LDGLDSSLFADLFLVLVRKSHDCFLKAVEGSRIEVFTHAGKFLTDFFHSLDHLGAGNLAVLGDVAEDRFSLVVTRDGHARDRIKHLEGLDDEGSDVDTFEEFTSSRAFIELANAVLESLDGGFEINFSTVFLGEDSDSVSDGLGGRAKVVLKGIIGIFIIVECREDLASFLQLLTSDGHAAISVDLAENCPSFSDRGDSQARGGRGSIRNFGSDLGSFLSSLVCSDLGFSFFLLKLFKGGGF